MFEDEVTDRMVASLRDPAQPEDLMRALREVADVYFFGLKKYKANDWMTRCSSDAHYAAFERHLNSYVCHKKGYRDPESKSHPIAHAVVRLLMIMEMELREQERS